MSGRKAVEIKRFGLTQVYVPKNETNAVAIVVFVHGLFGHPQRTWTGREETRRSIPTRAYQRSNASLGLEQAAGTGRLSVTTDSETEPEISNDTSIRGTSLQEPEMPCSSMVNCSQIVRLQSGEVFWPEAILPSVLPEARILTWGYDADVDAFNTSVGHNNVEQHANDLLTDVANLLDRLGVLSRPIIFVVHSLGGIVVKEALNIASQSEIERLKAVASATYGISFLGTPHRGSGSATIGKHAYRIARLATKRPNIKLLRSLEKNSDTLKGISNRFRSTQQKWDIKISSFYEDREVRKFFVFHSLIVDNESAQIGHPGEEVSSIPKNHREMTKFTSSEEVGFDRVSSQLRRWVNDISVHSQAKHRAPELEECLSSLENSQTRTRYINVASSYDGTFQWLFDREVVSFVDWLEEDQNVLGPSRPIFWINGKPGSGKSTLMKFAMRDERTRALLRKSFLPSGKSSETQLDWIILGFLFHDRGSHIQKSIEGMPQGVLHQLLSQVPDLLPFVYAIYDDLVKVQRKSKPAWTFESLCAAWKSVTQQQEVPLYACMFLDALDEHEGDNDQLSKFIYGLRSSADGKIVRIKICVASRTWNIFGEHFGTCPQFAIHEHTAADIQAYTSERLSCSMTSLGEDLQLALSLKIERLSLQVTTKARRVFIWVRIVLDELVKGIRDGTPISLLEEKVSAMPEELGDLYRHTLERIESDYAEEAYIMLQITLCSLSPLVLEAFMMCASLSKWGEAHHASEEEMVRQLISRSGGLLEIVLTSWPKETRQRNELSDDTESSPVETSPSVQFIHQTVKDFVTENHNDLGLHLEPTFKKESGYLYLLESGTSFGHTWPWAQDLGSSIFEYAFLAETEGSTDGARLYKAFSPMRISGIWGFESWIARVYPQYSSSLGQLNTDMRFLVLAAAAGLKSLVDYFLNTFLEVRTTDAQAMFLTIVATGKRLSTSSASRESMIKLLLKHGFCTTGSCPSLRSTHEIERVDTVLGVYSPLAWVLRQNFQEHISKEEGYSIAQLLLENGSDPNAEAVPDTYGAEKTSLLYSCIKHYDVEAVRLLLLYEAKTTDIDTLPLHFGFRIAEIVRKQKLMSSCSESMDSMGYGLPKTCIRLHFLLY